MPLYRKKSLTQIDPYTPGMEDGIDENGPYLNTLEGKLYIPKNGHIATGPRGERWAIQDDIFIETYEEVPSCPRHAFSNSYCRVMVDGRRTWVITGLQCSCGYHLNNKNGLRILKNKSLF